MPTPASTSVKAAPEPAVPITVASLLEKGDGVLMRRSGVWTYPTCPNDRSGTNLILPTESVSEAEIQDAIAKGDIVATAIDGMGSATSVSRSASAGGQVRYVNMMQAGSVEAATELPPNSRPTHDAGRSDKQYDAYQVIAGSGGASKALMPVGSVIPPNGPIATVSPTAPKS